MCRAALDGGGPFAVVNADDFYGADAFRVVADGLGPAKIVLAGYRLRDTLPASGAVSRAVCSTAPDGRLQAIEEGTTRDEIVTVIEALLSPTTGVEATKRKGEAVLRVRVREGSRLVGKTPAEVNFRVAYGAAIVAAQRGGRRPEGKLGQIRLAEGDSLVLQLVEDSPLLSPPPEKGSDDEDGTAAGAGGDGAGASPRRSPTRTVHRRSSPP